MNPDTAEMASVDAASELVGFERPTPGLSSAPAVDPRRRAATGFPVPGRARLLAVLRAADPAAVRDSWRALWSSRLLVWAAGMSAVLAFGAGPVRNAFNPPGVTRGFGWLGDLLAAPAARWDAAWYLVIAHYGYRPDLSAFTSSRTAFFPLYPLGLGAISRTGVPPVLAGVLLSLGALGAALYGIHRLTTLELARMGRSVAGPSGSGEVARLAVLVTAFAPIAFYFSAVYSESLYLALSVGVFWCARKGRWVWVGVLGALAAATRSTGLVLMLPAAMLYLYGPREDRAPDLYEPSKDRAPDLYGPREDRRPDFRHEHPPLPPARRRPADLLSIPSLRYAVSRLRPNYRLRRDCLWLALLPAGLGLYMAYLALDGGSALLPFHAQSVWGRHFAGPYLGVWDGAKAAFEGARQLLSLQRHHVYFPVAGGSPFINAGHNLMLFAFLLLALPAIVGVLRMLPPAYGVYAIAALAMPLSYPVASQPLMSLPRFLVVLFPLSIWLAVKLAEHPRARVPALVGSALLLMLLVGEFATWHWVA